MKYPIISLIIPVYKVEKYIEKCIESVLKQTFTNFEVLVVDDGSPDNSISLAKKIAKDDKRFVWLEKQNGGLSDARNYGLEKARGEYVSFLDSDDSFEPEMLKSLLTAIQSNDADMAFCDVKVVFENGEIKEIQNQGHTQKTIFEGDALIDLLLFSDCYACNKLFKMELFKGIRFPLGTFYEDVGVFPLLLEKSKKLIKVNKAYYNYLMRENSITNDFKAKSALDYFGVLKNTRNQVATSAFKEYWSKFELKYLYFHQLFYIMRLPKHEAIVLINKINEQFELSLLNKVRFLFLKGNERYYFRIFKWKKIVFLIGCTLIPLLLMNKVINYIKK